MCGQEGDEAVRGPSATLRDSSQVECGNHSSSMLVGNLSLSDCLIPIHKLADSVRFGVRSRARHKKGLGLPLRLNRYSPKSDRFNGLAYEIPGSAHRLENGATKCPG